jgi:hypothetical protein
MGITIRGHEEECLGRPLEANHDIGDVPLQNSESCLLRKTSAISSTLLSRSSRPLRTSLLANVILTALRKTSGTAARARARSRTLKEQDLGKAIGKGDNENSSEEDQGLSKRQEEFSCEGLLSNNRQAYNRFNFKLRQCGQ